MTDTDAAFSAPQQAGPDLDKPIYTIGIAAEIAGVHPRTLMVYEAQELVVPHRTSTNRRMYSRRHMLTLDAIQTLMRTHGLNLNGVRCVIPCLKLIQSVGLKAPILTDIDVTEVELYAEGSSALVGGSEVRRHDARLMLARRLRRSST
ncbi:MAG: MerR family transcriptional regulator [Acidimicrobiales bacterium]